MKRLLTTLAFAMLANAPAATNDAAYAGIPIPPQVGGVDGQVVVDLSREIRPIKTLNGVNGGPMKMGTQNFDFWKEAEIPYARLHDLNLLYMYGAPYVVDIPRLFPDFDADENDPASYDFTMTDELLKRIQAAGTKVFYRLGACYESRMAKHYTIYPPKDFAKWARICEHVIAHYTEGWAGGFKWDIQYWEIWNEPDIGTSKSSYDPARAAFWYGSRDQFKELFKVSLKHLKGRFPHLKFGGPALAFADDWFEEILKELAADGIPLDFASWHHYSTSPRRLADLARGKRKMLDRYGYAKTESILGEWNYVKDFGKNMEYSLVVEKGAQNHKGAAFIAAVFCALQNDGTVDISLFYDARLPSGMNNLFSAVPAGLPMRGYYPFAIWRDMRRLGTQVGCVSTLGDVYACAAKGRDGRWGALVARYNEDNNVTAGVKVSISLAGGIPVKELRCHQTDEILIHTARNLPVNGDGSVEFTMRPNSFFFFEGCMAE